MTPDEPQEPIAGIFTDLFAASREPPPWLIDGVLPEGLTWVIGPPKQARKTTLTMAMALQVAGFQCDVLPPHMRKARETGVVIVISAEATAGALRHDVEVGMRVKGEANGAVLIADNVWSFRLDRPEGIHRLKEQLLERRPKLLVLDPLRNLHSQDENDSGAMMDVLAPWQEWAKDNHAGVVCCHHVRKPSEARDYTADDARGSTAIIGMCDAVMVITPKQDHLLVKATFKRAQPWERLLRLGTWGTKGEELLFDVDKKVLKLLAQGNSTGQAAAALHVSADVLSASVQRLERNGHLTWKGSRWIPIKKR